MDYALPRGGLDRIFKQYDHIASHHPPMQASPVERNPNPPPADEPPWWSPDDIQSPPISQKEHEQGAIKQNLGYDPRTSWQDIDADRMEASAKKMNERFKNPNGASFAQDEEGLTKAYGDETAPGVYYDPSTSTEYVKGSVTARYWWDDASKIPFWGDTRKSERYQQADKALQDLQAQGNPSIAS